MVRSARGVIVTQEVTNRASADELVSIEHGDTAVTVEDPTFLELLALLLILGAGIKVVMIWRKGRK